MRFIPDEDLALQRFDDSKEEGEGGVGVLQQHVNV